MKKLLGVIILIAVLIGSIENANASETLNNTSKILANKISEIEYDISKGGTQEFILINENGEEDTITIKKEKNNSIIAGMALGNGTYTISHKRTGSWEASYQIVLNNEKITAAKNAKATAITGSFTSKSLKIDNSKQSTYYLTKKNGSDTVYINLRAKIANSKISVTI